MPEKSVEASPALPDGAPAWAATATRGEAFLRGMIVLLSTPGLILFTTSIGFGALVRDAGMTFGHAVFLAAFIYALPAQVVLTDNIARGASLTAAAFAVSLTAIRLLPMTVSLMPLIRDRSAPRPVYLLAVHFVAITSWVEGNRRLPLLPERLRLLHYLGIGFGMVSMTIAGSMCGHGLASGVPVVISAALLFMTPVYFLLSLLATARLPIDRLAIALGSAAGPVFFILMPGFDLLAAGVFGGTLAHYLSRRVGR